MIQMVRFEIKKMLSKTGGKIALVMIFLIVVIVSVFAVRSVDFVKSDGSSITGIRAAKELRYMKSAWTGYLTEDVFAEVIRLNAEVEETPEAQSKDWHESNKAYAMKQGYLDIRDIINSALSPFREYNYYNIDGADPGVASEIYERRIANLENWLASDEAKDRYSETKKQFFVDQYSEIETPLYYEDADGWKALLEYSQTVIMLTMLILSFLVCNIYSGEYHLKADSVFFSSLEGRRKGVKAKLLAGLLLISIIYWSVILIYSLVVLSALGSGGWNCPIQVSLYGWKSFYNITFLETYTLTVLGGYVGILFILTTELFISVITRSAVVSITFPFVLLFLPSFVGSINSISGILGLMPDQLLQISVAVRLFNAYEFGNTVVGALPILFMVYSMLFIILIPVIYRVFRRAEVC